MIVQRVAKNIESSTALRCSRIPFTLKVVIAEWQRHASGRAFARSEAEAFWVVRMRLILCSLADSVARWEASRLRPAWRRVRLAMAVRARSRTEESDLGTGSSASQGVKEVELEQ